MDHPRRLAAACVVALVAAGGGGQTGPGAAEPLEIEWLTQFGSPAAEGVYDIAVLPDFEGVYVCGYTDGVLPGQTGAGDRDSFIRKCDAAGNRLWTRQFGATGSDALTGIATDPTGVYVAGNTTAAFPGQTALGDFDAVVHRYDPSGNHLWTRQFGTTGDDRAIGITAQAGGNYVCGFAGRALPGQASAGSGDAFLRKYDRDGREVWTRQFGSSAFDGAWAVTSDSTGVYVGGRTDGVLPGQMGHGGTDAFACKYDFDGHLLWTRQIGTDSWDLCDTGGISASASGVYVGGTTAGSFPGHLNAGPADLFLRKYDPDGNELWTRQFGTSGDEPYPQVRADAGGAYVSGWTTGAFPGCTSAGGTDMYVLRFDANGDSVWNWQFGTPGDDGAAGLTTDGAGNVYVSGGTRGVFPGQASLGGDDAVVLKLGPPERIVDDGDPGTLATGIWSVSGGANPWEGRSLYSSAAGAEYRWKTPVPAAGSYEVFLWWTSWPSRLADVPVTVRHAFGSTTVPVDQRSGGGRWSSLGVFSFTTDATVTVRSLGGGSTCADAVRVLRVNGPPAPPPLEPIVIDDGSSGASANGSWPVSGAPLPWGGRSLYSKQAGAEYRFETPIPEAGSWEVFLWWTAWPSRLPNVPVVIEHAAGISTVRVDQLANGGKWNSLGVYSFGADATIRVRSLGVGSTCADAVRLVRVPGPPPPSQPQPIIVDDGGPGTSRVGYWPVSGASNPWGTASLYSKEAGAEYRFEAALPAAGSYEVFAWWTSYPSRLAAVPVTVRHGSGEKTLLVDQLANGGKWNSLGIFEFSTSGKVFIRSLGGGSTCADAVSFVPRGGASP